MPERAKSAAILRMEGKSHRTKQELAVRERAESESMTGHGIQEDPETAKDKIAHAEFVRVTELLKLIEKDDDLYGSEINLYCRLKSEITAEEKAKKKVVRALNRLNRQINAFEDPQDILAGMKVMDGMLSKIGSHDSRIMQKRKMRIDIENKNLMNIASSLRSVPKTIDTKTNALKEALGG